MTSFLVREGRGHLRKRGKLGKREVELWLCTHTPRNAWSHQKLDEARKDSPPKP